MLINWMKSKNDVNKVRIFSYEKLITVGPVLNRRDSCYMSDVGVEDVDPAVKYNHKTKYPEKIVMLGVAASDREMYPYIFTSVNAKINTEKYLEMPEQRVLPWLQRTYPAGN